MKITNINPQQEATLSLWKKLISSLRVPEMEPRSWSTHLKGASPNVRAESH